VADEGSRFHRGAAWGNACTGFWRCHGRKQRESSRGMISMPAAPETPLWPGPPRSSSHAHCTLCGSLLCVEHFRSGLSKRPSPTHVEQPPRPPVQPTRGAALPLARWHGYAPQSLGHTHFRVDKVAFPSVYQRDSLRHDDPASLMIRLLDRLQSLGQPRSIASLYSWQPWPAHTRP
jgi:hypothetical protein